MRDGAAQCTNRPHRALSLSEAAASLKGGCYKAMSQVFRISLTKAHLDQIPHDERVFYLMAGQLSNDINILTKLLWFAFNQHMKTEGVVKEASLSQTVVKLLAGKLYEGHSLIRSLFSAKKL
jgi:hypothetical protein